MASSPLMLNGNVDDRDALIEGLRAQNRKLDEALRLERNKNGQIEASVRELRRLTNPFYQLFRAIHGEIDAMGIQDSGTPLAGSPVKSAAWEMWKNRLGGQPAKFIDALLVGGPMTQQQLRIAVGCAAGSVAGIVCVLNKAGLITKNHGKIALKEL